MSIQRSSLFFCKAFAFICLLAWGPPAALAEPRNIPGHRLIPGDLIVTEGVYAGYSSLIIPGTTILPNGKIAVADGSYPNVFNNESADLSFGITAPIYIEHFDRRGETVSRIAVPIRLVTTSFS